MKRLVFVAAGALLGMVSLSVGCATKTTQAPPTTQNVTSITGVLQPLSVPLEFVQGNANITIETPQGPQTIQLDANTTYSLEGNACFLDEIGNELVGGNTTYICSAIIYPCTGGYVAKYLSLTARKSGLYDLAKP